MEGAALCRALSVGEGTRDGVPTAVRTRGEPSLLRKPQAFLRDRCLFHLFHKLCLKGNTLEGVFWCKEANGAVRATFQGPLASSAAVEITDNT